MPWSYMREQTMIIFSILAAVAVFSAVMVITRKSPISSAIYLIVLMCSLAGLFALQGAFFIAALQVIVYAGAIMVLFIFVIMLINLRDNDFGIDKRKIQKYLGFIFAAVILLQAVFITGWAMKEFSNETESAMSSEFYQSPVDSLDQEDYLSAESVAENLFMRFAYPFEVTSILLLAAIIGAFVIARKSDPIDDEGEET